MSTDPAASEQEFAPATHRSRGSTRSLPLRQIPAILLLLLGAEDPTWSTIRVLLSGRSDFECVGELRQFPGAASLITMTPPDAVVLCTTATKQQTIECLRLVRAERPACKLVVIGDLLSRDEHEALSAIGVDGYLVSRRILPQSVPAVVSLVLSEDVRVASSAIVRQRLAPAAGQPVPMALSTTERAVLRALAEGQTHAQIANASMISIRTVERTIEHLRERVGAESTFMLAVVAMRLGLLP